MPGRCSWRPDWTRTPPQSTSRCGSAARPSWSGRSPPHVVVVLDEPVLHRLIGSPQVMADQLTHIAEMSERPNVSVQVIPADTGANAGLSGAFDLASGDGAPEVLRMEAVEDVTAESRSLVRTAANIFVRVQADALPRAASRALILEAAQQWKTR